VSWGFARGKAFGLTVDILGIGMLLMKSQGFTANIARRSSARPSEKMKQISADPLRITRK
jgi:hypothetical protein